MLTSYTDQALRTTLNSLGIAYKLSAQRYRTLKVRSTVAARSLIFLHTLFVLLPQHLDFGAFVVKQYAPYQIRFAEIKVLIELSAGVPAATPDKSAHGSPCDQRVTRSFPGAVKAAD